MTEPVVGNRDRCGRCHVRHGGNNHYCPVHGPVSEGCCEPRCNPAEWVWYEGVGTIRASDPVPEGTWKPREGGSFPGFWRDGPAPVTQYLNLRVRSTTPDRLRQMAGELGILATAGKTFGEPSISRMADMIAAGELLVVPADKPGMYISLDEMDAQAARAAAEDEAAGRCRVCGEIQAECTCR